MLENEFYTQERHGPFEYFKLGNFLLESGEILADATLAYAVHGNLNANCKSMSTPPYHRAYLANYYWFITGFIFVWIYQEIKEAGSVQCC